MRSVWLGALVVTACSSKPAEIPDASVDADSCPADLPVTPVTITGASPKGSLDGFHYAYAHFVNGFCPDAYLIDFTPTEREPVCSPTWMQLAINAPFTANGSNTASADWPAYDHARTDNVTFEATQLDMPDAMPAHIVGHFVSHDPVWSFDIAVDLTSQGSESCL